MTDTPYMAHSSDSLWKCAALLYALALVTAGLYGQFAITFSIALGGALALGNLRLLEKTVTMIINPNVAPSVAKFATAFSFYARLAFIAATLALFMKLGWIHVPALVCGLSLGVVSIFATFLLCNGRLANFHAE